MALTARQVKVYVHTVDVYRPLAFNQLANHDVEELTIPATATYSAVKCYRETKPEFGSAQPIGRTDKDILFTIDVFHFDVAEDIRANDVFKFTTVGHPDINQWFECVGDTMVKNWRANKHTVVCKRILKPHMKGITA